MISFQVSLRPSANQEGSIPDLISGAKLTGTDVFANVTLESSTQNLTTRTTSDLLYKNGDETVIK